MSLTSYQKKRNFERTPEPKGKKETKARKLIFVIQKHEASHLHYDLRLAMDGVLKSWVIPKGPSYDPKERHLAVEVEDHPMEYAKFEGTIPEGEYGAGTVMLWDQGTWEPIANPKKAYKEGKLEFTLHGEKLKGVWALIRMATHGSKPNWLFIKKTDDFANKVPDAKLLKTNSVKTGRTMDAISKNKPGKLKR